jgi:hypothetical protein
MSKRGGGNGEKTTFVLLFIVLLLLFFVLWFFFFFFFYRRSNTSYSRPFITTTTIQQPVVEIRGPLTVSTQPVQPDFSQVGILDHNGLILPLMGRHIERQRWQYFTVSNTGGIHSKLPVHYKGKDGMQDYGVDEITSGENVFVDGYKNHFSVTKYNENGIPYRPFL